MYICVCNGIKDSQIAAVAAKGNVSVSGVYKHFGCQPQCGKCVPSVKEQLKACGKC